MASSHEAGPLTSFSMMFWMVTNTKRSISTHNMYSMYRRFFKNEEQCLPPLATSLVGSISHLREGQPLKGTYLFSGTF